MVTSDYGFIYDIGGGKFALGLAGSQAQQVVKSAIPYDGGAIPSVFCGVTGRRPRIPVAAIKLSRKAAGRQLCRALGLV